MATMKLPGMSDDFQLPEDRGELMAWLKNFATKFPQFAPQLDVSPEELAETLEACEKIRAAKEADDAARLKKVERRLCAVPDAWPPPRALHELMRAICSIEEPQRTRMIEEIELWTGGIERAGTPRLAPVLRGEYFDEGIVVRFMPLPAPCEWARVYSRQRGESVWELECIVAQDYYLSTKPEDREEGEPLLEGVMEFIAIGVPPGEDLMKAEPYGAPSEVLAMAVPAEYPPR
jgi:hypothetical protein